MILQEHILEKKGKFSTRIGDNKQLERFSGCITYASNSIKDLA